MRVFAFFLALGVLSAQTSPNPFPPFRSVAQLKIIFADGTEGSCSGVSVQEGLGNFLTSAHCLGKWGEINGKEISIRQIDQEDDIALISLGEPSGVPAIRLGKAPKFRDKTEALGFAFHSPLLVAIATIFQGELAFEGAGESMVFIGNTTAGMSGGAIVNANGQLVSLVKGGGKIGSVLQTFGLGVRYKAMKKMYLQGQMN